MLVISPTQPTLKLVLTAARNMVVPGWKIWYSVLNYALVDEVDSILIDEARTPLIVSGPTASQYESAFITQSG